MRLRSLHVHRMPGIGRDGIHLDEIDGDVLVVVGRNGSGKTTMARALRALLWPRWQVSPVDVEAAVELRGDLVRGRRIGTDASWAGPAGAPVDAPVVPGDGGDGAEGPSLHLDELVRVDALEGSGVAAAIARELAGGLRPAVVREELHVPDSSPRLRAAVASARDRVREVEAEQRRLEHAVAELDGHRAGHDRALAAREEQRLLDAAARAAAAREAEREARAALEELPPALAHVREDDPAVAADLAADAERAAAELDEARTRLARIREELGDAADADGQDAHGQQAERELARLSEQLRDVDAAHAAARKELAAARAAHERIAAEAGADGPREAAADVVHIRSTDVHAAEELAAAGREVAGRAARAQAERAALDAKDGTRDGDSDAPTAEALASLVDACEGWLAIPEPGAGTAGAGPAGAGPPAGRGLLLAIAGAALVAGVVLALLAGPQFWAVAGAGVGLAVATLVLGGSRERHASTGDSTVLRRDAETLLRQRAARLQRAVAEPCTRAGIRELRDQVAGERAHAAAAEVARAQSRERRARLEAEEREIEREQHELAQRRMALRERLGLAADAGEQGDALVAHLARLHLQLVDAAAAATSAERAAAEREEQLRQARVEAVAAIRAAGLDCGDDPGVPALRARADDAAAHLARRRQLAADAAELDECLPRLEQRAAETRERLARFYAERDIEVGDDAALARLHARREEHERCVRARDEAVAAVRAAVQVLGERDDLAQLAPDEIARRRQQAAELAAGAEELGEQIARTRADAERAMRDHDLAEATAAWQRARAELEDLRDRQLRAAVGRWLLDQADREYERVAMPKLLERARELAQTFTAGRYELRVDDSGDTARLVALDLDDGIVRQPHELSTGTRVQVLLAARLAAVELAEDAATGPVPLLLDEALATADEERLAAVATTLARASVATGRQVLYLTSDPADVERVRDACEGAGARCQVVDLDHLRGRPSVLDADGARRRAPAGPRPAAARRADETWAAWAERLEVPELDPAAPPEQLHPWHLLDDEVLVARLVDAGLTSVGRVGSMLGRAAGAEVLDLDADDARHVQARLHCWRAFVEAWGVGRGRAVDAATIAASPAISERFEPGVIELAEALAREHDGGAQARALVEVLAGDREHPLRPSRFQRAKAEELAAELTAAGYLDDRDVLGADELRDRVLAAAGELEPRAVAGLLDRWLAD